MTIATTKKLRSKELRKTARNPKLTIEREEDVYCGTDWLESIHNDMLNSDDLSITLKAIKRKLVVTWGKCKGVESSLKNDARFIFLNKSWILKVNALQYITEFKAYKPWLKPAVQFWINQMHSYFQKIKMSNSTTAPFDFQAQLQHKINQNCQLPPKVSIETYTIIVKIMLENDERVAFGHFAGNDVFWLKEFHDVVNFNSDTTSITSITSDASSISIPNNKTDTSIVMVGSPDQVVVSVEPHTKRKRSELNEENDNLFSNQSNCVSGGQSSDGEEQVFRRLRIDHDIDHDIDLHGCGEHRGDLTISNRWPLDADSAHIADVITRNNTLLLVETSTLFSEPNSISGDMQSGSIDGNSGNSHQTVATSEPASDTFMDRDQNTTTWLKPAVEECVKLLYNQHERTKHTGNQPLSLTHLTEKCKSHILSTSQLLKSLLKDSRVCDPDGRKQHFLYVSAKKRKRYSGTESDESVSLQYSDGHKIVRTR